MNVNEHKFLADFQPFEDTDGRGVRWFGVIMNWVSLFGVFYVIGFALRLGLGLNG